MFHAGDQIENPVTGERIVFHETSAETNGERVVFETIVQPGGFVASAHLHPFQTERFEVLEGTLGMRRGKEKVELGAGETIVVEPGTRAQVLERRRRRGSVHLRRDSGARSSSG